MRFKPTYFLILSCTILLILSAVTLHGQVFVFLRQFLANQTNIPVAQSATINLILNPGFELDFASWTHSHSPATSTATEEITTTGCYSGKCLKLSPGNSDWQSATQNMGMLEPGKTYLFSAKFKTTITHKAYLNLKDFDWKDSSCVSAPKNNVKQMLGTGNWETINFYFTVPATDDCGQSTASHNWSVVLAGHYPTTDSNTIYYDDISLSTNEIADLSFQDINSSMANIEFTTAEPGQSRIEYGINSVSEQATAWKANLTCETNYCNTAYPNFHSQTLSALMPNTQYIFRVAFQPNSGGTYYSQTTQLKTTESVSINGDLFGVAGTHFLGQWTDQEMDQYISYLAQAGVRKARIDIIWKDVEPQKGIFSFKIFGKDLDKIVNTYRKYGIEVLGLVQTTPNWATTCPGYDNPNKCPPNDINDYKNFLKVLVNHYKSSISYWEIWNEPNTQNFFNTYPDTSLDTRAQEYVKLLSAAYTTIKLEDPQAIVVSAGLAGGDIDDPDNFLSKITNLGFYNYCDKLAFHPYARNGRDAIEVKRRIEKFIGILGNRTSKPLWITEVGWVSSFHGTNKPDTPADESDYDLERADGAAQAAVLASLYENIYKNLYSRVENIFWFAAFNCPLFGYGLLEHPHCAYQVKSPDPRKPAYYAYSRISPPSAPKTVTVY